MILDILRRIAVTLAGVGSMLLGALIAIGAAIGAITLNDEINFSGWMFVPLGLCALFSGKALIDAQDPRNRK